MTGVINGYKNNSGSIITNTKLLPYDTKYNINWPKRSNASLIDTLEYAVTNLHISEYDILEAVFIPDIGKWALFDDTLVSPIIDDIVVYHLDYYIEMSRYLAVLDFISSYSEPVYSNDDVPVIIGNITSAGISWRNNKRMMYDGEDVFRYVGEVYPVRTKYVGTDIIQYWPTSWNTNVT
jgi:hypothetical protein